MRSADAVIANLECPVTTTEERWAGWKMWKFRAKPEALAILRTAGVAAVALANNHALDRTARGLFDTINHLDAAGIAHAGAGADAEAAASARLVELGPLRLGFISLTDNMPEFAAGPARPGTHFMRIDPAPQTLAALGRQIRDVRRRGADFVLVSAHWGPNFRTRPTRRFQDFAHRLIEMGVDIIHGHSAHHLQGIEHYRGGLILYDTGNFLDDYDPFPFCDTYSTALFLVDIEDGRPWRLRLVPARTGSQCVRHAAGRWHRHIVRRVERLSRPFGTVFKRTDYGLECSLGEVARLAVPEPSPVTARDPGMEVA
jgi:poly-gamma-glutamate synthesis protein (capsule biosynthesis protein)